MLRSIHAILDLSVSVFMHTRSISLFLLTDARILLLRSLGISCPLSRDSREEISYFRPRRTRIPRQTRKLCLVRGRVRVPRHAYGSHSGKNQRARETRYPSG